VGVGVPGAVVGVPSPEPPPAVVSPAVAEAAGGVAVSLEADGSGLAEGGVRVSPACAGVGVPMATGDVVADVSSPPPEQAASTRQRAATGTKRGTVIAGEYASGAFPGSRAVNRE
jgi:hypothetical protein